MAKKSSQKNIEQKQNIVTTIIACVVLLCVLVTGIVVIAVRAQNEQNAHLPWQGAFARYFGGTDENALEILSRDYEVTLGEKEGFGTIVSVINGTEATDGFEWGVWLNGTRITDRPADKIETKLDDVIIWQITKINGDE
ncbi:hypothetical protein FWG76_02560 [Candidatus Saccharibacteria bacterium]|nr:hypothetical protein [Candidatus Saccharibacteria bacterium]